jgi:hypothetical protein
MSDDFSSMLGPLGATLLFITAVLTTQKRRPAWRTWIYVVIIGVFGVIVCRDGLERRDQQRQKFERLQELRDKLKAPRS